MLVSFSCTALPPEFFQQTIDLEIYGIYEVSPETGLVGLGYIHYQRNNKPEQAVYKGIPSYNYLRATIP